MKVYPDGYSIPEKFKGLTYKEHSFTLPNHHHIYELDDCEERKQSYLWITNIPIEYPVTIDYVAPDTEVELNDSILDNYSKYHVGHGYVHRITFPEETYSTDCRSIREYKIYHAIPVEAYIPQI